MRMRHAGLQKVPCASCNVRMTLHLHRPGFQLLAKGYIFVTAIAGTFPHNALTHRRWWTAAPRRSKKSEDGALKKAFGSDSRFSEPAVPAVRTPGRPDGARPCLADCANVIRCALVVLDRTRSFELTPRRDFPVRAEPPRPARFFVQAQQAYPQPIKKAAAWLPFFGCRTEKQQCASYCLRCLPLTSYDAGGRWQPVARRPRRARSERVQYPDRCSGSASALRRHAWLPAPWLRPGRYRGWRYRQAR